MVPKSKLISWGSCVELNWGAWFVELDPLLRELRRASPLSCLVLHQAKKPTRNPPRKRGRLVSNDRYFESSGSYPRYFPLGNGQCGGLLQQNRGGQEVTIKVAEPAQCDEATSVYQGAAEVAQVLLTFHCDTGATLDTLLSSICLSLGLAWS